jgi:hypothetical protein
MTAKRPASRPRQRRITMTDDDLLRDDRLRALRLAIDNISTRRWTDDEWIGWLRHELKETIDKLSTDR